MRIFRAALTLVVLTTLAVDLRGAALPFAITIDTVTINGGQPAQVGVSCTFTVTTTVSFPVLYRWTFDDGTTSGAYSALNGTVNHTYTTPGHRNVLIEVQDGIDGGTDSQSTPLLVHYPVTNPKPTNSSTIILDVSGTKIWVVNPDQDTVTCLNIVPVTPTILAEVTVGQAPRTLAQAADGRIWVVSQQHPSISIINNTTFALEHVIPLPHGSLPYGIAMSPDGLFAYVTLQGLGGVRKIDTETRKIVKSTNTPASARGVSVKSDGKVLVTRFISPQSDPLIAYNSAAFISDNHGEVVELNSSLGLVRTFKLAMDPGPFPADLDPDFGPAPGVPPTTIGSRGIPNYLTSLVITPDGRRAWVPSKKDNVQRGKGPMRHSIDPPPGPEVTYRAIVSSLDLVNNVEPPLVPATQERFDIDNSEMPQAACTSPRGDYLFIALQGTNKIQVRDLIHVPSNPIPFNMNGTGDVTGTSPTSGLAPQGIVFDPSNNRIYVQNYMSRTVAKIDATAIIGSNGVATSLPAPSAVVSTILLADKLVGPILPGKQIFYNSGDPRMSSLGYISCAGCHLDGGADARVFDFTNRGEGFRNTVMLQGRGGMAHGNVHWSANFNEIQDFENDIVNAFGGLGFSGGLPNPPLGTPNAGRPVPGAELDQLAAYVASLTKVSRSPFRNSNGSLTATGAAGEALFKSRNCQQCHGGRAFADSTVGTITPPAIDTPPAPNTPLLHNIGTVKKAPRPATSGQRLGGGTLPGVDTPTLKGIWQTAPYLHDGSAATLEDVFADLLVGVHFFTSASDRKKVAQYMREIDEIDAPPVAAQNNEVTIVSVSTGRPYSLAPAVNGALPFVDRAYTITGGTLPDPDRILVRTAEDDKMVTSTNQLRITFGGADSWNIYVCYDPRSFSRPDWIDFTYIPAPLTITMTNITNPLLVYAKLINATLGPVTVTFGGNLAKGANGALRNYFLILERVASPGTEVWEEGPLNKDEWVHDQDADGDGLLDEYEAVAPLSPWIVHTGVGLPTDEPSDEDKTFLGATTHFMNQGVPGGGGGGGGGSGGGCGLAGFEVLIPLALLRLLRRRRA